MNGTTAKYLLRGASRRAAPSCQYLIESDAPFSRVLLLVCVVVCPPQSVSQQSMADKAHLQALYRAKADARGLARPPSVAEQRAARVKSEAELPQEKAVAVPMQPRPEPRGAERKDEEPQAKKPRTAAPGGALPSGFFDHGEAAAAAKLGGKEPLLEQSPADAAAAMREFNEAIAQDVQQLEARELEEEEAEVEEKHSLLQFEQQCVLLLHLSHVA